jgi:hypothetical protein
MEKQPNKRNKQKKMYREMAIEKQAKRRRRRRRRRRRKPKEK